MISFFAQVSSYLQVTPLALGNTHDPVYLMWDAMRNLANVLFVIFFIAVIFSEATSLGISNYGIKRMLPRLLSAAVLANISFYILALVIDFFNIVGAGIGNLVISILSNSGLQYNGIQWSGLFYVAAVGFGTIILFGGPAMAFLFGLIGIIFLLVLAAIVVLVLRQMVIILLVALSPILFMLRALKNTEKWYNRGAGLFWQLMFMYPIIVLLFASGKIVGTLLAGANWQLVDQSSSAQGVVQAVKNVAATFAAALPLAILPFTFKIAGGFSASMFNTARSLLNNGVEGFRGVAAQVSRGAYNLDQRFLAGQGKWGRRGVARVANAPRLLLRGALLSAPLALGAASGLTYQRYKKTNDAVAARDIERFQTRRLAKARFGVSKRQKGAATAKVLHYPSEDIGEIQELFEARLASMNISTTNFLTQYTRFIEGRPGSSIVRGSTGSINLSRLSLPESEAIVSLAGSEGDVMALAAMRLKVKGNTYQNMVTKAIGAHSAIITSNGGEFLLDPALANVDTARATFARDFNEEAAATSGAALKAANLRAATVAAKASHENLLSYGMVDSTFRKSSEGIALLTPDHQEALAKKLISAVDSTDLYTSASRSVAEGAVNTVDSIVNKYVALAAKAKRALTYAETRAMRGELNATFANTLADPTLGSGMLAALTNAVNTVTHGKTIAEPLSDSDKDVMLASLASKFSPGAHATLSSSAANVQADLTTKKIGWSDKQLDDFNRYQYRLSHPTEYDSEMHDLLVPLLADQGRAKNSSKRMVRAIEKGLLAKSADPEATKQIAYALGRFKSL